MKSLERNTQKYWKLSKTFYDREVSLKKNEKAITVEKALGLLSSIVQEHHQKRPLSIHATRLLNDIVMNNIRRAQ